MKYQQNTWSCGAAAVRNALRALGTKVSELKVRQFSDTSQEGTDSPGVLNAIRSLGFTAVEFSTSYKSEAWEWIYDQLYDGNPVVLCIEGWQHWVVAIGILGNSVVVVDSSNFAYNKAENGVRIWNRRQLMYHWWNGRKSLSPEEERIYAITVKR